MCNRAAAALLLAAGLTAQPLRSLKSVPVPVTPGVDAYVLDHAALIALGKAFFWDMQAGSDGRTACATCHFHAGADHRRQNQIADPNNPFPANLRLTAAAFPLRQLADPANRNSTVLRDTEMRIGSAGLLRRLFTAVTPGEPAESGVESLDHPEFTLGGLQLRRFNGHTPSGIPDEAPGALVLRNGQLVREPVFLDNASLASQATGPILDALEMSYAGRTWAQLGRKMYSLRPLALQRVAADDSVLAPLASYDGPGLRTTYLDMIRQAFRPEFWDAAKPLNADGAPDGSGVYRQAEINFPLFWGLALQAYQSTLISDDSPFDRFQEANAAAFTNNGGRGNRAFQRTGVRNPVEDAGSGNGNFKSIGLRNIELTGPYFHNGGQATLEQVIDFYARGGDFANNAIRSFNMSSTQKAALAAFRRALTDDRVRYERAPFDHPELCVPTGAPESRPGQPLPAGLPAFPRTALETWAGIPAVGAAGNKAPLQTFEELLLGIGAAGARSNTMDGACTVALP